MHEEKTLTLATGDHLFREGDSGDTMYVLVSGIVELRKKVEGAETMLKIVSQPGEFFGEMSLIDGQPRSATALAVEPTRVLAVDEGAFEAMIETNGAFALKVIKALSARIRHSNVRISELIDTDPRDRFAFGLVDFSLHFGEKLHDGGCKVDVTELGKWLNGHFGITLDDVEKNLFRLVKAEAVRKAVSTSSDKSAIVVPPAFIMSHNRRSLVE